MLLENVAGSASVNAEAERKLVSQTNYGTGKKLQPLKTECSTGAVKLNSTEPFAT